MGSVSSRSSYAPCVRARTLRESAPRGRQDGHDRPRRDRGASDCARIANPRRTPHPAPRRQRPGACSTGCDGERTVDSRRMAALIWGMFTMRAEAAAAEAVTAEAVTAEAVTAEAVTAEAVTAPRGTRTPRAADTAETRSSRRRRGSAGDPQARRARTVRFRVLQRSSESKSRRPFRIDGLVVGDRVSRPPVAAGDAWPPSMCFAYAPGVSQRAFLRGRAGSTAQPLCAPRPRQRA
jgi:hypothetical protein